MALHSSRIYNFSLSLYAVLYTDLLIDISDVLQICCYELGRTYLKLSQALCINLPSIGEFFFFGFWFLRRMNETPGQGYLLQNNSCNLLVFS